MSYKKLDENKITAFDGFTEKEIFTLHNNAKLLKLKAGDVIFKEDTIDETLYILISGLVKLSNSISMPKIELKLSNKNIFIDESTFIKNRKRLFSAVTLEPSTVMAINEKNFELLPQNLKLSLLKNLCNFTAFNNQALQFQIAESNEMVSYLNSYIKKFHTERSEMCEKSEMIQNILKKFPRLPPYATRLTELLLDEKISVQEAIELAKTDPSLVADTLKTINSAYYNLTHKVTDFQHAVMFLGFNKIYQIAMDCSISNLMPNTEEFRRLRHDSILRAAIGVEIALQCGMQKPLIMSTIGMLHNIGKNIVFLLSKEQPFLSIFFKTLDDAKLGSMLLKEWNLPEIICNTIEYYQMPKFAPPEEIPLECRDLVSALYLASLIQDYLEKKKDIETKTFYLDKYMNRLKIKKSFHSFAKDNVFNVLRKKIDTFPEDIRALLA